MAGVGGVVGEKWRQLYLNNNKKKRERDRIKAQIGRYKIERRMLRKV